jgi:hypothetical protein
MVRRGALVALSLAALALLSAVVVPALASTEYDVDVDGSIDTADRDVTVDGDTFTVTAVGTVSHGEAIAATVDAPAESNYDLYLYDSDRRVTDAVDMDGSGSAEFETDYLSPGSYVVAVYTSEGTIAAVQPVVVSGYDVSVDAPTSVTAGTAATVDVTLTETTDAPDPERVEVVVLRDGSVVTRVDATADGDGFAASLPSDLAAGEYRYYVGVRGPTEVNGRHELVALDDGERLRVEATDDATGSDGGSGGDDGSDASDGGTAVTTTETTSPATTSPATTTAQTSTVTPGTTVETTATETTTDGVITPNGTVETTATETTTATEVPARGVQLLGLLLVALVLAFRRP